MSISLTRTLTRKILIPSRAFSITSLTRSSATDDNSGTTTTPQKSAESNLYGTAPYHKSYILLHASEPPSQFPSRFSTPLQKQLQLRVMKWGGLVNFSYYGPTTGTHSLALTAFSTLGGRLEIPELSMENIDEVARTLERHANAVTTEGQDSEAEDEVHLLVCTHGARDCRCGEMGGELVKELRKAAADLEKTNDHGFAGRIRVGEVAHVGGHKLGNLKPEHAKDIINAAIQSATKPLHGKAMPLLPSHWRGRMGLDKYEQEDLFRLIRQKEVSHQQRSQPETAPQSFGDPKFFILSGFMLVESETP
ncbi:hypothetical protein H0H93_004673 [Arthromyces matolae]|nr:hypothetical protein H0H93_004673 [Arthromyces matolae]